jgi:predicted PurR-regulated permease PerM
VYAGVILLLAGMLYFVVPSVLSDVLDLLGRIPEYAQTFEIWNPLKSFGDSELGQIVSVKDLIQNTSSTLLNFSKGTLSLFPAIFGGFVSLIFIFVLSFYLTVQENGVANFLQVITPLKHEKYVVDLWQRAQTKIGLWMQGQMVLALIIGVLVYLGLAILGIPNALFLAFVAAIFEIIPVFGPILSAIPAVVIAISSGGVSLGILVIGLYVIVQQFENHLIYPLVVKKIVGVPPLMVILALFIGAKLAGFWGVVLAVPLVTALMEFYTDIEKSKIASIEKMSKTS